MQQTARKRRKSTVLPSRRTDELTNRPMDQPTDIARKTKQTQSKS